MQYLDQWLFNVAITLVIAPLWGLSEKAADLADEHGYRFFPGAAYIFGVAWGSFQALLPYCLDYGVDYRN